MTQIEGGIAANVIPDRVEATLSFRYAPDRTPEQAEEELRRLAGDVEIVGNSPAGRVVVHEPLVDRLREAGAFGLEPKQAWTNVAEFTSRGVDAVNFGPGKTSVVHAADEQVEVGGARARVRDPPPVRGVACPSCASPPSSNASGRTRSCGSTRHASGSRRAGSR